MYTLPPLPYDYDALEPYIDTETMHLHHDRHHDAYTKSLNEALTGSDELSKKPIEELLRDLSGIPEEIRRNVQNFGGGYYNHTFFWDCMSAVHDQKPGQLIAVDFEKTFGGFDAFRDAFTKAALSQFGSGWAWLIADENGLSIVHTANQDTPMSEGKTPLLTLDVWEHAYYLKYRQARAAYIEAWWHVVNWKHVEERYKAK